MSYNKVRWRTFRQTGYGRSLLPSNNAWLSVGTGIGYSYEQPFVHDVKVK